MAINSESKLFFSKLSKIWQNFKDYTYLEGIDLSPDQISIIEQECDQLLIEGYAGTGKSLTLLYKLINVLIREEGKRILFVTFNKTLIDDTKKRLNSSKEYLENKDKHNVNICTFHEMAGNLLKEIKVIERGAPKLTEKKVKEYRDTAYRRVAAILDQYTNVTSDKYKALPSEERLYKTHNISFVTDEITWLKAMGFIKKEKYLVMDRIGRSHSIRLTRSQRNTIFKIFEQYEEELKTRYHNSLDLEDYALRILENPHLITEEKKFDYIFVDEVQDLDPMQIKALCNLTKKSIVLSGDAKQRIYKKTPIKYEDIGLNIKEKGKRKILNKNFRSTSEIVKLANSLEFYDNDEKLMDKLFVRNGEKPLIYRTIDNHKAAKFIAKEVKNIQTSDPNKNIAIVHREESKANYGSKSALRLELENELKQTIIDINTYDKKFQYNTEKQVFYTNAYDIKGLEFDTVFIVDFNTKYYPNSDEIKKIRTENEKKDENLVNKDILDFINREKKLLYVAMTRAKDNLFLIANNCKNDGQISKFIYDFDPKSYITKPSNIVKKDIEDYRGSYENYILRLKNSNDKDDEDEIEDNDSVEN